MTSYSQGNQIAARKLFNYFRKNVLRNKFIFRKIILGIFYEKINLELLKNMKINFELLKNIENKFEVFLESVWQM